ncbi:MAG: hypothetical protein R3C59_13760 [Planctomycetaceae bacterium]
MQPSTLPLFVSASFLCWLPDVAVGQISFGVVRQNGVITGGGFQVNGIVINGGTGVRLGVTGGTSQLIGLQNFNVASGGNNVGTGQMVARQPPKPSAGLFVKATRRFDKDEDGRLNREELNRIAVAVLTELRKQQDPTSTSAASSVQPVNNAVSDHNAVSDQVPDEMVDAFVRHCLTFDKDNDEALDLTETKRMAAALIRELS